MTLYSVDGKGLIKTSWPAVRDRVAQVEPIFATLVDDLSPDHTFPLYLAYYPYGAVKGDTISTFLPLQDNRYIRLSDSDLPVDIENDLGYGRNSSPLALVLEKSFELFVDQASQKNTIPRTLYAPGAFFPFARILSHEAQRVYAPNRLLTMTSGARSVFMLPNIGCSNHHSYLQRDYQVKSPPPKTLYDQWAVFREIAASAQAGCNWRSCLLYFSQKWLDKLFHDKKWLEVRLYLHELAWKQYEYQRNHYYYDFIFSLIQKKRNLKPNPYLADTAKHLFTTALGAAPGYVPAYDDSALPVAVIQRAFSESYGLNKYHPILMRPAHYNYEQDQQPVYYSLQYPSTHVFSPRSRKNTSVLAELRELEHITSIFRQELACQDGMFGGTVIHKVACNMRLSFFHNERDNHRVISPTSSIPERDARFCGGGEHHSASFSRDAAFVRGCVSIAVQSNPDGASKGKA